MHNNQKFTNLGKVATNGNEIGFSYYVTKLGIKKSSKSYIGLTEAGRKHFQEYASTNTANLLDAAGELIRQCGANIVLSEKRGASYQLMAKISSNYSSSAQELSVEAQASGSFFEVSSKFNSAQNNSNQSFSLSIEKKSDGQVLNYPELDDAISQCSLTEDGQINQSCKDIFSKYAGKIIHHINDPVADFDLLPQVGLPEVKPLSEFDPEDILTSAHETALNKAVSLYKQQYERLQNLWIEQKKLHASINGVMHVYSGNGPRKMLIRKAGKNKPQLSYAYGNLASTESVLDKLKQSRNDVNDNVEKLELALFSCSDGICKERTVDEVLKSIKPIDSSIINMVNKVQPVALGELKGIQMPTSVALNTGLSARDNNCNDELQIIFSHPDVESVIVVDQKLTPQENHIVKVQGLCAKNSKISRIPIFVTLKTGEVAFRFINSLPGEEANKFAVSSAMELNKKSGSAAIDADCSDVNSNVSITANMIYEELNSKVAMRVYSLGSCQVYGSKISSTKEYGIPDKQRRLYIDIMETKGKNYMPLSGKKEL
ncbi:hypothetical protein [Cysteiniphilum marinum]|uniref:hypothetical protein n=1 Tax=Cysteiniphilum marinum TaxID=2774191 RepID=UPI00193A1EBD|nr:hypothetical protein [Cysteiniphilum marinum]